MRCTSSSSDAVGWAASSPSASRRRPHRRGRSTRTPTRSASACPRTSAGRKIVGFGFDRDHLIEAGIERAGAVAAVTSGDNSNILTARIARENFGIERVVARIYDPRRALDLPAPRHPDRRHGLVDHRSGDAPAAARARSSRTSGSTRAARSASLDYPIPPRWAGKKLAPLSEPGVFWLVAITRLGDAQVTHAERDRPGRRHPALRRRRVRARRAAASGSSRERSTLMRVAIAGAGNVGLFIANDLARRRPRGAAHRAGPRRS